MVIILITCGAMFGVGDITMTNTERHVIVHEDRGAAFQRLTI